MIISVRLRTVHKKLTQLFPDLIGTTVSKDRLYITAYNQIDGCIENMEYDEKLDFVNKLYES